MSRCVLVECEARAPVYTLCDTHRKSFDIHVFRSHSRRKAEESRLRVEARKQAEQDAAEARVAERKRLAVRREKEDALRDAPPRGMSVTSRPLEAHTIAALRQALLEKSTRQLREEIGISHFTIYRLAESLPGTPMARKTHKKLQKWMGIE